MCLAVPAKIIELSGNTKDNLAIVDLGGVRKEVSVRLLDNLKVGEYVLIHAGFAISKIDENEAVETLSIFKDMQG